MQVQAEVYSTVALWSFYPFCECCHCLRQLSAAFEFGDNKLFEWAPFWRCSACNIYEEFQACHAVLGAGFYAMLLRICTVMYTFVAMMLSRHRLLQPSLMLLTLFLPPPFYLYIRSTLLSWNPLWHHLRGDVTYTKLNQAKAAPRSYQVSLGGAF